uniref:Uncharacterized protein n=1 Tax=Oryza sativa subsp. japonica TaxID=39947 RepID=Q8LIS1_ORYSJ|nr:hypothetical protein [Oryza sativa Japonica Group]BAD31196.1 hypothetical protein [Oryza sativa Japonica Group]
MGVVKSPAVVFLVESDQLKKIYPEESEFNEDAESFFLVLQGLVSPYGYKYVYPGSF